jgi:hypothetical protein
MYGLLRFNEGSSNLHLQGVRFLGTYHTPSKKETSSLEKRVLFVYRFTPVAVGRIRGRPCDGADMAHLFIYLSSDNRRIRIRSS